MTYHPGKEASELVEFSGVYVLLVIHLENCPMETFIQIAPPPHLPKLFTFNYISLTFIWQKNFILEKKYYTSFFFDIEK